MAAALFIATAVGLYNAARADGAWRVSGQALSGLPLTSVAVRGAVVLAGSPEGIWRSRDAGRTWLKADEGLALRHVRWVSASPGPGGPILAGTEPAGIFVSRDAGASWDADPGVWKLRDANGWFLPYSPRAGCVRGFAVAASGPDRGRIYAAVEVGGVLVSDDDGRSWRLAAGSDGKPQMDRDLGALIHPDVHSIAVHPSSSDCVTAATGGGLFRSVDGGRSWKKIHPGYVRAAWVDPCGHRHIIAGPADGVSRNGRVEASLDGGRTWHPASTGMQAPWADRMVERFFQLQGELIAVSSGGELWSKTLNGSTWSRILPEIARAVAVAAGK
ncbi:MAG: glycoside hydrolase [Desulfobacterales bacterium]|jgi:photosystem II stability/assembly factor-like uncharacterized protein|nr:glycoside hydrolase [Desulfobacterales bacterium]